MSVTRIVLALIVVVASAQLACPPGWVSHGRSCYLLRKQTDTWYDAKITCEAIHGRLLEVDSPEENTFVAHLLQTGQVGSVWMGLVDLALENHFVLVSSEQPTAYTNWRPLEPNDQGGGEDCTELVGSGFWNDIKCHSSRPVLCERDYTDAMIG